MAVQLSFNFYRERITSIIFSNTMTDPFDAFILCVEFIIIDSIFSAMHGVTTHLFGKLWMPKMKKTLGSMLQLSFFLRVYNRQQNSYFD